MIGAGSSSNRQPMTFCMVADLPICVPMTNVIRLYCGEANAWLTGFMYGVRHPRNGPGSGEPGGIILFSSAQAAAVLGGFAFTIWIPFSRILSSKALESFGCGSADPPGLGKEKVLDEGWVIDSC